MLPVGRINIFVCLNDPIDPFKDADLHVMSVVPLLNHPEHDQDQSVTLPISGGGSVEDANTLADDTNALINDADSSTLASRAGSIVAASHAGSITCIANPINYEHSIDPLIDSDSNGWIPEEPIKHRVVLMANPNQSPDPFTTPILQDAPAAEIEAQRKALDDARIKEATDHEKFYLEQHTMNLLTQYHQRRMQSRMAAGLPTCTLTFNDKTDLAHTRDLQICNTGMPGGSRAGAPGTNCMTTGVTSVGAPPSPDRNPPQGQLCIVMSAPEVNENGLPLLHPDGQHRRRGGRAHRHRAAGPANQVRLDPVQQVTRAATSPLLRSGG
jgi:hypothetical protein